MATCPLHSRNFVHCLRIPCWGSANIIFLNGAGRRSPTRGFHLSRIVSAKVSPRPHRTIRLFLCSNPAELNGYTRKTISDHQSWLCFLFLWTCLEQLATRTLRRMPQPALVIKRLTNRKFVFRFFCLSRLPSTSGETTRQVHSLSY